MIYSPRKHFPWTFRTYNLVDFFPWASNSSKGQQVTLTTKHLHATLSCRGRIDGNGHQSFYALAFNLAPWISLSEPIVDCTPHHDPERESRRLLCIISSYYFFELSRYLALLARYKPNLLWLKKNKKMPYKGHLRHLHLKWLIIDNLHLEGFNSTPTRLPSSMYVWILTMNSYAYPNWAT